MMMMITRILIDDTLIETEGGGEVSGGGSWLGSIRRHGLSSRVLHDPFIGHSMVTDQWLMKYMRGNNSRFYRCQ